MATPVEPKAPPEKVRLCTYALRPDKDGGGTFDTISGFQDFDSLAELEAAVKARGYDKNAPMAGFDDQGNLVLSITFGSRS